MKEIKLNDEKGELSVIIDEAVLTDMETIDMLADLMNASKAEGAEQTEILLLFPSFINKIFGKDQKKKVYDHFRDEDGHVPIDKISKFVFDVMAEFSKKN